VLLIPYLQLLAPQHPGKLRPIGAQLPCDGGDKDAVGGRSTHDPNPRRQRAASEGLSLSLRRCLESAPRLGVPTASLEGGRPVAQGVSPGGEDVQTLRAPPGAAEIQAWTPEVCRPCGTLGRVALVPRADARGYGSAALRARGGGTGYAAKEARRRCGG